MSRVFLLTHYTPLAVEMSAACREENAAAQAQDNQEESYEIEVFKSQIVTVASCGFNEDRGTVENIRYKSCGHPPRFVQFNGAANSSEENNEKNASVVVSSTEHKARRFKRISLPQWLLKPSRKASHNSSRIRRVSGAGKHRILRINSAPKTLGSGNNFAHYRSNDDKFNIFQKGSSKERVQQSGQSDLKPTKESRKIRRISLPAHVLEVRSVETPMPRTPELPRRKKFDELDENFLQSLRINDPHASLTSKPIPKQGAATEENPAESDPTVTSVDQEGKMAPTRGTREASAQVKNARKESSGTTPSRLTRPTLKLHKFHNPDIFYVPLPEDHSQSLEALPHKLCRARLIEPKNENYMIQECVKEELQAFLHDKQFCSRSCQQWCLELSQNIKTSVHRMKDCESKIACVVYIGALRGHGVHAAAQCIWTPNDDNFITVNYKNRSMIAIAAVLAIKYV